MELNAQQEGAILDAEKQVLDQAEMGHTEEPTQAQVETPDLAMQEAMEEAALHQAPHHPDFPEDAPSVEVPLAEALVRDADYDVKDPLGTKFNPIGTQDPTHMVHWHGRTITDVEHIGSAPTAKEAIQQSIERGTATCHTSINPLYKPPAPAPEVIHVDPQVLSFNRGFRQGWYDADRAYQDLKNLVQLWITDQHLAGVEVDDVPMVIYVRNNR